MKVESQEIGTLRHEVTVVVEEPEVSTQYNSICAEVAKSAQIRGFRRGHVPRDILKLYYGKTIQGELVKNLVSSGYEKALKEKDLAPIGEPDMEIPTKDIKEGEGFSFRFKVDVKPKIDLTEYKGIEVPSKKVTITEEDVDKYLKIKQEENAEFFPVEGRPAEKGDYITVEYHVLAGDKEIDKRENAILLLGSGTFPEPVESTLISSVPGKTIEVKVPYPKDQSGLDPSAKNLTYRVTVKGIKQKRRIIIDDEFAKDFGGFPTLVEYREHIRQGLEKFMENRSKEILKDNILEKLLNKVEFSLPQSLVDAQVKYLKFQNELKSQARTSKDAQDESKAPTDEVMKEWAEKQVKAYLLLEEIARKENIEVREEEVEARAKEELRILTKAGRKNVSFKELKDNTEYEIRREKILEFLVSNAKVVEEKEPIIISPGESGVITHK